MGESFRNGIRQLLRVFLLDFKDSQRGLSAFGANSFEALEGGRIVSEDPRVLEWLGIILPLQGFVQLHLF